MKLLHKDSKGSLVKNMVKSVYIRIVKSTGKIEETDGNFDKNLHRNNSNLRKKMDKIRNELGTVTTSYKFVKKEFHFV